MALPPLVLLHGIGSRRQVWDPIVPALAERFAVTALDLPGASVPALADRVLALVPPPFHVAGSSMGGGVALELGRRGQALSVTAFAPIGFWGTVSRRWCQVSVTAARVCARSCSPALPRVAATAAGRVALFGLFFGHPTRVDPVAGVADARALAAWPGFRTARDAFAHHRFTDPGGLTDVPVTVVWGARDLILPAFQARRAARLLPAARHIRLAGCGHLPFADDPDACLAAFPTGPSVA
ncbi:alpha/beta fold hydrolase [Dactylosporangium sp. NPDC051541]|uniref:alpha/beta fold hydrolase n=1 Tax=Dactylosporangium sp. NPDC051541 TaxID=3363977 RepID=UPI0037B67FC9